MWYFLLSLLLVYSTLHKIWSFPLRISSHLLKKSLRENFIFCAVQISSIITSPLQVVCFIVISVEYLLSIFYWFFGFHKSSNHGCYYVNHIAIRFFVISSWYHMTAKFIKDTNCSLLFTNLEAAKWVVLLKKVILKICKVHRKIPVPESLF